MIKIKFTPAKESPEIVEATKQYTEIWNTYKSDVVRLIEEHTGLYKWEDSIDITVHEGISQSHPFFLRASYSEDTKLATLVHELIHRILDYNKIHISAEPQSISLEIHKLLDLILYDIWTDLRGEEFAKRQVEVESRRTPMYEEAWDYALSMSRTERQVKFKKLIKEIGK
ncbi:MAG: hypothetical protein WCF91_03015 [bacterium]|jgi:hypothetical protein